MPDDPQIIDPRADTVPGESKPGRATHTIRRSDDRRKRALEEWSCALLAGLALFPGLAGAATLVVYLADWPADNGAAQFGVGVGVGVAALVPPLTALLPRLDAAGERKLGHLW